jgi:hypothetical protein
MSSEIKLVVKDKPVLKLTNMEKYSLCIQMYKDVGCCLKSSHIHHIKPKHLYPECIHDKNNIVRVPDVVHFLLHRLMPVDAYSESEEDKITKSINKSISKTNPNKCLDFGLEDFMFHYLDQIMRQYLKCKKHYLSGLNINKCLEPEIDVGLKTKIQFIHDDFVILFATDIENKLVANDIDIDDI